MPRLLRVWWAQGDKSTTYTVQAFYLLGTNFHFVLFPPPQKKKKEEENRALKNPRAFVPAKKNRAEKGSGRQRSKAYTYFNQVTNGGRMQFWGITHCNVSLKRPGLSSLHILRYCYYQDVVISCPCDDRSGERQRGLGLTAVGAAIHRQTTRKMFDG